MLYIHVMLMDCPFCLNSGSKVTNKRNSPDGVRRRRECLKCKRRFTTYERFEQGDLWVIKKNGERERFDRCKLEKGVIRAVEKRDVAEEKIKQMINKIEEQIRRKGGEVKSSVIGSLVMRNLKKLDNVAFIRFASVYNDFQNVGDFKEVIKKV